MDFRSVRALRGPNVWSLAPVVEAVLDAAAEESDPHRLPVFLERLQVWFPRLLECVCVGCNEEPAPAVERRERFERHGSFAFAVQRLALELQRLAGSAVNWASTVATAEPGVYKFAVEFAEEEVVRDVLQTARKICEAGWRGDELDVNEEVRRLRSLNETVRLGPSTGAIVRAARQRGIPSRRLNEGSLVQLGWGARQHRILAAETDRTSAIAESIAQDKELTKELLRAVGVPVPQGRPVADADDAWEAACEVGVPVVVKPQYGNQGRGVAVNLTSREQVMAAYQAALEEGQSILVERFSPGADHRLLVVGDKLIAAARREPPQVLGDGRRTIAELVDEVNQDPRRGEDHATPLSKLKLDAIAVQVLSEQGFAVDSIPPAGRVVVMRRNANLSTGGTATDVTDLVHPEVAARAVDAARVIGLDICGVDVVAEDVSRPLEDQNGVVVEVNAAPGLRMHLQPSSGKPQLVGEAIVGIMFAPGDNGRIPLVAVTGVNGKTTTTRCIAHLFRASGRKVGMTCTDGIYVNDHRIDTGDCSGPRSARGVLLNPQVEVAVLETARGGILREGLGFDRCDVAVVTNISEGDHLGMSGIDTLEQLARVKRVIVEAVHEHGTAVLNADDPLTAAMAPHCPGRVLFFAENGEHPLLVAHRQQGERVIFVRHGWIIAAEGASEQRMTHVDHVPLTLGGRIAFQVENVLAAAGAAWAAGLPFTVIEAALRTFASEAHLTPGRFNVLEAGGATVILDYGHNTSALHALVAGIERIQHKWRTIVYTAAGDRRDVDIIEQAEILGHAFDHVVIYEDQCTRGRADGEVIRLMREGLAKGRRKSKISETRGELKAVEMALQLLRPGDLCIVQVDQVELAVDYVRNYLKAHFKWSETATPAASGTYRPAFRMNGNGAHASFHDGELDSAVLTTTAIGGLSSFVSAGMRPDSEE